MPREGSCAFCRTGLTNGTTPPSVLTYLAQHLPTARVRRYGLLRSGPVSRFRIQVGGGVFEARVRGGRLVVSPGRPEEWVGALLAALDCAAESDPDVRDAIVRAGWALGQLGAKPGAE